MTGGSHSVTIKASPEEVWKWVADLGTHSQWAAKDYSMEWTSGEPNAVGSKYHSVGWVPGDKNHPNDGVITENKPYERFALQADDKEGLFTSSYDLKPVEGGTEVTFTIAFPTDMKGMSAMLAPIAFPLAGKPEIRKRMQKLKETVEAAR